MTARPGLSPISIRGRSARSLLCREFNAAGVDAQPAENRQWRITEAELTRVNFAAFLMPTHWADLSGRTYRLHYPELQQSDFWKFFHLHEVERTAEGKQTAVLLRPGAFQQELVMRLWLDDVEGVRRGSLALRRGWIVGPPHGINPLATDITKSFLGTLLPEPDRAAGAPYIQAIVSLRPGDEVRALAARRGEAELSTVEQLQLTYLGLRAECSVLLIFFQMSGRNVDRPDGPWLELDIDLF
jgi:hypothetical protein